MSHVCAYSGRRTQEGELPYGHTNRGRLNRSPEPMNKSPITANRGAAEERRLILRKINQLEKVARTCGECHRSLFQLKEYIKGMAKRASAKQGGLGKK